jgi:thioredoxin reductase
MSETFDVVIVGGGMSGLSAALMLGRSLRSVLVLDAGSPRNAPSAHAHGLIGREGVDPLELLRVGRAEVEAYGVRVESASVDAVTPADGGFAVSVGGRTVRARKVLVATGLRDELPPVPGLAQRWGADVVHCPYCHGHEFAGRPTVVLVHDAALFPVFAQVHRTLLVRQLTDDVTLVIDRPELLGEDRAKLERRGVAVVGGSAAAVQVQDDAITGLELTDGTVVPTAAIYASGAFVPLDELLRKAGAATEPGPFGGEFVTVDRIGKTSVPGLFAAGNAVDPSGTLATVAAAGSLAGAAINAELVEDDAA